MASAKPPFHGIQSAFNCLTERIYFIVDDYSYEITYHPEMKGWVFESERLLGKVAEHHHFDGTVSYPETLCARLRRAAAFVQAWYDVVVDCRVGTAAFARWTREGGARH